MNRKSFYAVIKLLGAILVGILFISYIKSHNPNFDIDSLQEFVDGYGVNSVFIYLVISSIRTILFVPTPLLYVVGGIMFGTLLGILYTTVGIVISTILCYLLARKFEKFFSRFTKNSISNKIKNIEKNKVIGTIFTMRAIPGIPYDALSISAGIVKIDIWHLLIGTVLGIMPKAIILGSLGSNLDNLFSFKVIGGYIITIGICLIIIYVAPQKHFLKAYRKAYSKL